MSSKEMNGSSDGNVQEDPLEEFYRLSRKMKSISRNLGKSGASFELDSFIDSIFNEEIVFGELDGRKTLKRLLLGVMDFTGAQRSGLYLIDTDFRIQLLAGIGVRNESHREEWVEFFRNTKEMMKRNDLHRCMINGEISLLLPLRTAIGAHRHFIFLTGLEERRVDRAYHLVRSPMFKSACGIVRKDLLFFELLKDSDCGLINGNAFFRVASVEFDHARVTGSPLAIGALYLKTKTAAGDDLEVGGRENSDMNRILAAIGSVLREEEIITIHNPDLFIILMPSASQERVERIQKGFQRFFREEPLHVGEDSTPAVPLFGVACYDGGPSVDYSELLMTLSEALDHCLDTGAQFVLKYAGRESSSRFVVSDLASEILFQSLNHNKLLALYKISQIFSRVYELKNLFNEILDLAISAIGSERGLFCVGDDHDGLRVVAARNTEGAIQGELNDISRSIIGEAMRHRKPVFSQEVDKDANLKGRESIVSYGIRSVLCMPLCRKTVVHGALYLDIRTVTRRFSLSDLIFLKAFSNQAVMAIENAKLYEKKEAEIRKLRVEVEGVHQVFIGQSEPVRSILKKVHSIRNSDVTVLIQGENGSGKELLAKTILTMSNRKDKPFLTLDCSAISDSLIESELFGHVKGSFTGARTDRVGLFEAADTGTIFLDEIDSLNRNVQGKLLRVIEEGEIRRIGENTYRKVDVRVIAATKQDLKKVVKRKEFREDLYYRLNVFLIKIPSLRERKEDIILLANHFLQHFSERDGKRFMGFTEDAVEYMRRHTWPGNVRELRNVVERSVINAQGDYIRKENLLLDFESDHLLFTDDLTLQEKVQLAQRQAISDALLKNGGNITATAKALDISRRGLQKLVKKYGIDKEDYR